MKARLSIKILLPIAILFMMALSGCGGNKSENTQPTPQSLGAEAQGDKIPEQLEEIESSIEGIFMELKGPSTETEETTGKASKNMGTEEKKAENQEESTKAGEKEGEKSGGGKEESSTGMGEESSSGSKDMEKTHKTEEKPTQKPKTDPWLNISPLINKLHYQWNSYMPMAAQKGANQTLTDNFSKALNSLTNTVVSKNSTNTLMAANYLYASVPDFYALYRTEMSPEIKRIKYYTRNAMLNSWTANWPQAEYDINSLKASWPVVKNTISKDQQDNGNKLDYSLYELEKVIKEKNQPLIDIKGRVALSNIAAIEKGMKKGSSGGGGDSGGEGSSR